MIQNSPSGGTIKPSSLNATAGRVAAVATALLLVAFLVLSVSRAAFTASTLNEKNFVTTDGFVTLTDNDQGSALFELTAATPNTVTVECIHVQYNGAVASGPVKMYATVGTQPTLPDLSPYLNVTVDAVPIADALFDPLGAAPDCTQYTLAAAVPNASTNVFTGTLGGTVGAFPANYGDGPVAFAAPTSPDEVETFAFRITVQVQNDANASNSRADWAFWWEAQG